MDNDTIKIMFLTNEMYESMIQIINDFNIPLLVKEQLKSSIVNVDKISKLKKGV